MYPKKKSISNPSFPCGSNYHKNIGWNDCRKHFTQEIKKRADVERLAKRLYKQHLEETTYNSKDEKQFKELRAYKKEYWLRLAQAISTHITEGLEEEK